MAKILCVSDSVSKGKRVDTATGVIESWLSDHGYDVVDCLVCPDGAETVAETLKGMLGGFSGLVVTTGGTGFGRRDLTPEGTQQVLERLAPGLVEEMRRAAPRGLGALSRAVAGTAQQSLVINLPGSPKGCIESLDAVKHQLIHALELLAGGEPH